MSNALQNQVDGHHYTDMVMQPVELAYLVGGTPCFCKLAKYATRIKGDRQVNLDKAIHCIELEWAIRENHPQMVEEGYPLLNSEAKLEQAAMLVKFFTKDENIQYALISMLTGNYSNAVTFIQNVKRKVENGE